MIKITGHTPPDTDTVCSPIVYAWYMSQIKKENAIAVRSGDLNKETSFVLDHFDVEIPENIERFESGDKVIVIDTNNPEELPDGIDDAEIIELIDHHKLAGLKTATPTSVTIRTYGCSATIIWEKLKGENLDDDIPKDMAGLLLAAILSDTLKFSSPTTTENDKTAASELADITETDINEFASKMFEAKSDLAGMSAEDVLLTDSKVFEMGDEKVRVSVLETTKPDNAIEMISDLKSSIEKIKEDQNLDYMFFFIVDILQNEATLIVSNEDEQSKAEEAFESKFEDDVMTLPGVVSRKKQMVPNLEGAIS